LLATDGLRFDPWERAEWPETAPEWNEMFRRWHTESNAEKTRSTENQLLDEGESEDASIFERVEET
jgi:signal-transduction protein with cAMP-binding, CBS, and nucleotidyltransferase domain